MEAPYYQVEAQTLEGQSMALPLDDCGAAADAPHDDAMTARAEGVVGGNHNAPPRVRSPY